MVIRAFVHLVKVGRPACSRQATLCRRTKRQRLQVANPDCRHGDADLRKAETSGRAATLCRQTRRQRLQVATPVCRHGDADRQKAPYCQHRDADLYCGMSEQLALYVKSTQNVEEARICTAPGIEPSK